VFVWRAIATLALRDLRASVFSDFNMDGEQEVTSHTETYTVWEVRCPFGEECGSGYKLKYRKPSKEDGINQLAEHMFHNEKHASLQHNSWVEIVALAESYSTEYVVQSTREKEVWRNKDGEEVQHPKKASYADVFGGKGSKGSNKGKPWWNERAKTPAPPRADRRQRSRSRDHRRVQDSINNTVDTVNSVGRIIEHVVPMAQQWSQAQAAPARMLQISTVELDEIIDGLGRASRASNHCAILCDSLKKGFEAECQHLDVCKHMFERFRRSV